MIVRTIMRRARILRFIALASSFGCTEPTVTDRCVNDGDCNDGRACTLERCAAQGPNFFGQPTVSKSIASTCVAWARAQCEKEKVCPLIGWDRPAYSEQNICERRSEYDCRQLLVQPAFAEKVPVCAECATALEAQTCDQWLDRAPAVCNAPANSPDYSA